MDFKAVNFDDKYGKFSDQWKPRVIAEMNDYQFKLARIEGEFLWHAHEDTDETFIVMEGSMVLEFRDGSVPLCAGEMFVVPAGVEHKPVADSECKILLIEPVGVINTGDESGDRTAQNDVWI
jgi:mannose-6-phosphate isomerase-like protein (cupin superfamily)